jgi:hypothetical protein
MFIHNTSNEAKVFHLLFSWIPTYVLSLVRECKNSLSSVVSSIDATLYLLCTREHSLQHALCWNVKIKYNLLCMCLLLCY